VYAVYAVYHPSCISGVCPGREKKINKVARRGPFPHSVATFMLLAVLGGPLLAWPAAASSAENRLLVGRVVAVADGDTITVLTAAHARERIRLAGIDAPESRQAYGAAAKQRLSALVYGAEVRVEYSKRDRYGRIVGRVLRDGHDAGLAQVESGYAWHYLRYAREQSSADRAAYARAERSARAGRRGLWIAAAPLAPWDWRRQRAAARRAQAARLSSPQ
jgi:endonuclease YncB( thermonuclease family)